MFFCFFAPSFSDVWGDPYADLGTQGEGRAAIWSNWASIPCISIEINRFTWIRIDVFAFEFGSLFFDPFLISRLKKFRSIDADMLANFIVKTTIEENLGLYQYNYSDFKRFS